MMSGKKRLIFGLVVGALAVMMAMPAYAATRKRKISSIKLDIKADIEPDTDFGQETVEIESRSSKYEVDGYEVLNEGFTWTNDVTPLLRITLTANDNYYFVSLTKDKIKLNGGAAPVKATRQDSSTTLLLDVKLDSLQNYMKDMEELTLSEQGIASWGPVLNAASYEVKVYRDNKAVGSMMTTTSTTLNCRERMTKGDVSYTVKVRPVSALDANNKGEWMESSQVYISNERAAQFRENPQGGSGMWKSTEDGRWWYQNEDGSYPKNNWREIAGKWYFFDEEGYMKTGWISWNGKEYYCSENGDMLTDCLTPDSYVVGADGAKVVQ